MLMRWPRRILAAALAMGAWLAVQPSPALADMESTAQAAILIEGSTGRVLFEKNADQELPMASTTKIMTAITALTYGNPQDVVTVPTEAQGVEGSSIYLEAGEQLTLEELLYGLMLRSGNDAAVAIAIHVGGSIDGFCTLMNELAYEIGAVHSHFSNPHGLHAEDHYTTASDLAKITAYAMQNPRFAAIVATERKTIPWEGRDWDRTLINKNKILQLVEGGNGVKTGYTSKAGRCLVSSAYRDGMQLICVVLRCNDMFPESAALLNEGFAQYRMVRVLEEGTPVDGIFVGEKELSCAYGDSIDLPIAKDEEVNPVVTVERYANLAYPIEKGQIVGQVRVECLGMTQFAYILSQENYDGGQNFWERLKNWLGF